MKTESQKKKLTKVSVSGADVVLWNNLRKNLITVLDRSLDTIINYDTGATLKDETRDFSSAVIQFGKENLNKSSIENEKLNAQIEEIYTKIKKEKAETRKINAEADQINLDNQIKAIRITLGSAKALLIGNADNEDILFVKKVDTFLEILNELKQSNW